MWPPCGLKLAIPDLDVHICCKSFMHASDIDESIDLSVMMVNAVHHLLAVILVQLQHSSLHNFFCLLKYARMKATLHIPAVSVELRFISLTALNNIGLILEPVCKLERSRASLLLQSNIFAFRMRD
jgi:hypothetical protein